MPDGASPARDRALLSRVADLAREAGVTVMGHYRRELDVTSKADDSPVTVADREAEGVIRSALQRIDPGALIIAEEHVAQHGVPGAIGTRFWLVDPLDGTKEFLRQNGEFTVNIALIEDNRPVLGVVHAPALGTTYTGLLGEGAWKSDAATGRESALQVRAVPESGLTVVASRSHSDESALSDFLARYDVAERKSIGSSLKFCLLAEGLADFYPRLGPTMEWDIAAADAVLRAAGGGVYTLDGQPLAYGKAGVRNPHFVAVSASALVPGGVR